MPTPRLNSVIKALEEGKVAFACFSSADIETASALSTSAYDGLVFEMEHGVFDLGSLRDTLQHLLNRRDILARGSPAASPTPLVRIPPNGIEMNQWIAKQVLDAGVYGVMFPHVSTPEEAWNAVRACRYPRLPEAERYEPPGIRGDAPARAARYWGLTHQEYYACADVWPLAPHGEILAIIQIEDVRAIDNLPRFLTEVPGIGVVVIGEGDLSQELGHPREYDHPAVLEALTAILRICQEHGVACGHPHPDARNYQRLIDDGYRFLMPPVTRSFALLDQGRTLAGRA